MFVFYAEDKIRSNIKINWARYLFFNTRQDTLGPKTTLRVDTLHIFDILLLGLWIVLVKNWCV